MTEQEVKFLSDAEANFKREKIRCPQCGTYMADLGLDFKAPKKNDIKEWKIIEGLLRVGKCFYSCGCSGIGYIPKKQKDYESYLEAMLQEYESSLAYYQNSTAEEYKDRSTRIRYWAAKIKLVKKELLERPPE